MAQLRPLFMATASAFQQFSMLLIIVAAVACLAVTGLSFAGVLPWLEVTAAYGTEQVAGAGMIAQLTVTALFLMLLFYLPTNARVMTLETSHRRFAMNMHDVARAYHLAHSADRKGVFTLSSEFDAVKERIAYLNSHPDLEALEPAILEVAAQMSRVSQDLADTYSDTKVDRARTFLVQRQEELARFETRLSQAKIVLQELRQWHNAVELDESLARSQIARLNAELAEILPDMAETPPPAADNVKSIVGMTKHAAE
ncbi:MAG: DNA repair protein [Pseudomonadota bacterium]